MCTAAELRGAAEADDADVVAVLLAEERHGAHLTCLLDGYLAVLLQGQASADALGDEALYRTELLGLDLGKVGEVEAQHLVRDEGPLLLDVCAEDLT